MFVDGVVCQVHKKVFDILPVALFDALVLFGCKSSHSIIKQVDSEWVNAKE